MKHLGPALKNLAEAAGIQGYDFARCPRREAPTVHPVDPQHGLTNPVALTNLHWWESFGLSVVVLHDAGHHEVELGGFLAVREELLAGPQGLLLHCTMADLPHAIHVGLTVVEKEGVRHQPRRVNLPVQLQLQDLWKLLERRDVRLVDTFLAQVIVRAEVHQDLVPKLNRQVVLQDIFAYVLALLGLLHVDPPQSSHHCGDTADEGGEGHQGRYQHHDCVNALVSVPRNNLHGGRSKLCQGPVQRRGVAVWHIPTLLV
mmetsp:Transcript_141263/g.393690  ORF Transcript_141263/g.393690 Transcript_141263/m.393690 type:complete len:258 (-) Transcript_141263:1297-2070(-)